MENNDEKGHTYEEIMEMGHAAAAALNSPMYHIANKIAVDQAIVDWVNTSPKESQKRESLWHEVQAHGRINAVMQGAIERAQQVTAAREAAKPENRHLDEQGFGLDDGYPIQ